MVDLDPSLDDIRNTQRIHAVAVRGRTIDTPERTRMLAAVEAAAREPPVPGRTVHRAGCCH